MNTDSIIKSNDPSRRNFLVAVGGALGTSILSYTSDSQQQSPGSVKKRIFFASNKKIGMINEDGTDLLYLKFDIPNQVSWQNGPVFSDKRRMIVTSFEEGKSWEGNVRSHLWIYDLQSKNLTEIASKNRSTPFLVCCGILPGEERMITGPIINGEQIVVTMNIDGSDQVQVTHPGEGFTYGVSLSPDAKRLAFHATGKFAYRIYVINIDGSNRTSIAAHPDHLYFGTSWSPDGEWILYQDCHFKKDPGHEWSDLCLGRPDGSENRLLTQGLRQWFAASYGSPKTRGSGSNMPQWSPDGSVITYTRAMPDSKTAWEFQPARTDTNHFNRDYKPEEARGGTQICLLNPQTGLITPITESEPLKWDFRTTWSPDGKKIAFCRAKIGYPSELWIMDADGKNQRFLTRGENGMGADHPKFLF